MINEIIQLKNTGRRDDALFLLRGLLKKAPATPEMTERLWDLGSDVGMRPGYEDFFIAFIEKEIRRNQLASALDHFRRLKEQLPEAQLNLTYRITLIKFLSERNENQEAVSLATEAIEEVDANSPPGLLLELASAVLKIDPSLAERVVDLCDRHPEILTDQKEHLKQELTGLQQKLQTAS